MKKYVSGIIILMAICFLWPITSNATELSFDPDYVPGTLLLLDESSESVPYEVVGNSEMIVHIQMSEEEWDEPINASELEISLSLEGADNGNVYTYYFSNEEHNSEKHDITGTFSCPTGEYYLVWGVKNPNPYLVLPSSEQECVKFEPNMTYTLEAICGTLEWNSANRSLIPEKYAAMGEYVIGEPKSVEKDEIQTDENDSSVISSNETIDVQKNQDITDENSLNDNSNNEEIVTSPKDNRKLVATIFLVAILGISLVGVYFSFLKFGAKGVIGVAIFACIGILVTSVVFINSKSDIESSVTAEDNQEKQQTGDNTDKSELQKSEDSNTEVIIYSLEAENMFREGLLYLDTDPEKAVDYVSRAAEMGYPDALCWIGVCYVQGVWGFEINVDKAIEYFENASELGWDNGKNDLVSVYSGMLINCENYKDIDKAIYWLGQLDKKKINYFFAMKEIASAYGKEGNLDKQIQWLKKAQEWYESTPSEWDKESLFSKEELVLLGENVDDEESALDDVDENFTAEERMWNAVKKKEQKEFERMPGKELVEEGRSLIEKYYDENLDWKKTFTEVELKYEEAANMGNYVANRELGNLKYHYMFSTNIVQTSDLYESAIQEYEKAAEYNDSEAIDNIATIYLYELNEPEKAILWWKKNADRGDASAMFHIGFAFERMGNMEKSKEWYDKSEMAGF